jgi:diacylglycerol kinase family enzyme
MNSEISKEFAFFLQKICTHSALVQTRPLYWTIIANPRAGGFTIKSRWKKHKAMLEQCAERAQINPLRENNCSAKPAYIENCDENSLGLVLTKGKGHAREITDALLRSAEKQFAGNTSEPRPFYLIITAGGDGTSLEVMAGLYHAREEIRRDFAILRLPMGTGNDGADARELDKALNLLIDPAEIRQQRALQLTTARGKGPFLAFNILSVGIDAFVTHMTNKMKDKFPGNSYKLWVDIAALFYDRFYKSDLVDVCVKDEEGKEIKSFSEKLLLMAMGESGHRTYGANKRILPDDRNLCAVKQISVFRKLIMKELLASGTHICEPEVMAMNAHSVEFSARYPLLAQMDGESVLLEKDDFPARIELCDPVIPIIVSST